MQQCTTPRPMGSRQSQYQGQGTPWACQYTMTSEMRHISTRLYCFAEEEPWCTPRDVFSLKQIEKKILAYTYHLHRKTRSVYITFRGHFHSHRSCISQSQLIMLPTWTPIPMSWKRTPKPSAEELKCRIIEFIVPIDVTTEQHDECGGVGEPSVVMMNGNVQSVLQQVQMRQTVSVRKREENWRATLQSPWRLFESISQLFRVSPLNLMYFVRI
jgi:hypothetical protein